MKTKVENQLGAIRRNRGVAAADLAGRVGISRQTIYAIEAGTYVPNTEVTLRLARELQVTVEELFSLADPAHAPQKSLRSEMLSSTPAQAGQAVQVCRVGDRVIGIPVSASPCFLPAADGIISAASASNSRAEVLMVAAEDNFTDRLLLAGCDPAIGLLSTAVKRLSGVDVVPAAASSRLALKWLKAGKVHIAGTHLKDSASGEFNVPIVRREFPDGDFTIVTFARWEEGIVTAAGNPRGIKKIVDIARRGTKFINRESGSGSRALLDTALEEAGVPPSAISGHDRIAHGHLAAAYAVNAGDADCCIATRSAARTFGLDFVPIQSERYDFVLRRKSLELPAIQSFLDVLQKASLRRILEVLAGYDAGQTGTVVV